MKDNLIITISREFGSGGHEIGEQLANELNIPFYDRAIVEKAAQSTGFSADFISEHEQKYTSSLIFNMAMDNYSQTGELPLHDQIDIVECDIIKGFAKKGSCVIVGRCANYILEDEADCLNVFIYSDELSKIHRISEKYGVDAKKAARTIKDTNKCRSKHYNYFTGKIWGARDSYDLMLNTAFFDNDSCVQLIKKAAEQI